MSAICLRVLVLLAVEACLLPAQQPKSPAATGATASGVFVGRSGKPMARAQLMLAEVKSDEDTLQARLRLGPQPITAIADGNGRFQFKGFTPGVRYAFVYNPAGPDVVPPPVEINIKALSGAIDTFLPMLKGVEAGTRGAPYPNRVWARDFTLLKGHTLFCLHGGGYMKIWNATIRRGQLGPFLEMRKGQVVQEQFNDKGQLKLDAWSF